MKKLIILLLVVCSLKNFGQSQTLNSANVVNCACSGQLWDVSTPYKPKVTFAAAGPSHRIMFTNYGFTIPLTASVTGVEFSFSYTSNVTDNSLRDTSVQLLHNGFLVGTAKEANTPFYFGSNTVTIGGNGELWGVVWDPPSVNSIGFGFDFKLISQTAGNHLVFDNGASITIYYTLNTGVSKSQTRSIETKLYSHNKIVKINSEFNERAEVSVYSILGNKCASFTIDAQSVKEIDASNFTSGIYIYTIKTKSEERSGKFIVE